MTAASWGAVDDAACHAAAERGDFGPMRGMFDTVVSPTGAAADPTSALDRFALRTSRSTDFGGDAARLAGKGYPAKPVAKPPTGHVLRKRSGRPRTGRAEIRGEAPTWADSRVIPQSREEL